MGKQYSGTVIQEFECKLTKQFFPVGSQYVTADEDRIKFLNESEYVEGAAEVALDSDQEQDDDDTASTELKQIERGVYELPNGEIVKGKTQALKRLAEIDFRKGGQ